MFLLLLPPPPMNEQRSVNAKKSRFCNYRVSWKKRRGLGPCLSMCWSLGGSGNAPGAAPIAPATSFPKGCAIVTTAVCRAAKGQRGKEPWASEGRPEWAQ